MCKEDLWCVWYVNKACDVFDVKRRLVYTVLNMQRYNAFKINGKELPYTCYSNQIVDNTLISNAIMVQYVPLWYNCIFWVKELHRIAQSILRKRIFTWPCQILLGVWYKLSLTVMQNQFSEILWIKYLHFCSFKYITRHLYLENKSSHGIETCHWVQWEKSCIIGFLFRSSGMLTNVGKISSQEKRKNACFFDNVSTS